MMPKVNAAQPVQFGFEEWKDQARAAFDLLRPDIIRREVGMGQDKARKALEGGFDCIEDFDGVSIKWKKAPTPEEQRALKYFGNRLVIQPAFTSWELVPQFLDCLLKNKLIERKPAHIPEVVSAYIALYALQRMHQAVVILADGSQVKLQAYKSGNKRDGVEPLDVLAEMELKPGDGYWCLPIYGTNLDGWEWCEPELWAVARGQPTGWDFPLDIGPNGKLRKL